MWTSTVGLVNGKHRYLTAETFGFKINSNGQMLKKRQQWTIEPFPENLGPDGSISSAASVSSQCAGPPVQTGSPLNLDSQADPCILTFSCGGQQVTSSSLTSIKSALNGPGSAASDQDTCGEEHENVALKSHQNKYLAVDSFGNVTCDSDEKTENARFTITICSMSQGGSKDENIFWAFRNVERGYYLGTTEDGMICCNAKMPKSRSELWHLHLIPARGASFFAIKSLGRKRYARCVDESGNSAAKFEHSRAHVLGGSTAGDQVQVQLDATITWGPETLFQFKYYEGGKYSLLSSDCLYLTNEGKCVAWHPPAGSNDDASVLPPAECLFTLEYHSGFLAFRDSFSHYLAAAGRSSILRSRSIGVSRDELFVFESAPIQASLKATFNNRWVSIKQGVDLSANQMDTSLRFETFQLTYHKQTQLWSIMTHDCHFWTVAQNSSTISVCKPGDYEALTRGQFQLVWSETDATCSLKFVDSNQQERWIAARKSGQLFLGNNTASQAPVKFIMRFQNRRLLNLRPVDGSGFVGLRAQSNCRQLEANKTAPDSIAIEYSELPHIAAASSPVVVGNSEQVTGSVPLVALKSTTGVSSPPNNGAEHQTVNMFNVRLNSTKMGQSVLDRFQSAASQQHQHQPTAAKVEETISASVEGKEIDSGIDDNNNSSGNNDCASSPDELDSKINGVESASTPSVAAIINSFSNTKISKSPTSSAQNNATELQNGRGQSSVFKLVSNFQAGNTQQQPSDAASDTASVITSCSTASASSSIGGQQEALSASGKLANSSSTTDQLAQLECCYLKTISIDRYLVAGENETSVVCDATNKACAQPWILELRSHNSIAIRASDNHAYMQLGTNGTIFLQRCEPKDASLWEF